MSGPIRLAASRATSKSPLRMRHAVAMWPSEAVASSPLRERLSAQSPSPLRGRFSALGFSRAYGADPNLHGNPKDAHFVPQEPGKEGMIPGKVPIAPPPPPPLPPPESNPYRGAAIGFAALALLGAGAYVVYEKGEEAGAKPAPEEVPLPAPPTPPSEVESPIDQEPAIAEGTALVDPSTEPSALIDAGIAAGVAESDTGSEDTEAPAAPEPPAMPAVAPEAKQPVAPEILDGQVPAIILKQAGFEDKERAWFAKQQAYVRGWDGQAVPSNGDAVLSEIDKQKLALWRAKQAASVNGWPTK